MKICGCGGIGRRDMAIGGKCTCWNPDYSNHAGSNPASRNQQGGDEMKIKDIKKLPLSPALARQVIYVENCEAEAKAARKNLKIMIEKYLTHPTEGKG